MMHSQDVTDHREINLEIMVSVSGEASSNILLMNEAITLLLRKRRTLEEKAIARYFHCLINAYGRLIAHLHKHMSEDAAIDDSLIATLDRLRTVNENVRSSVDALLKILKYDLNFLEQYFEYDYCSKLLNETNLMGNLEELLDELGVAL